MVTFCAPLLPTRSYAYEQPSCAKFDDRLPANVTHHTDFSKSYRMTGRKTPVHFVFAISDTSSRASVKGERRKYSSVFVDSFWKLQQQEEAVAYEQLHNSGRRSETWVKLSGARRTTRRVLELSNVHQSLRRQSKGRNSAGQIIHFFEYWKDIPLDALHTSERENARIVRAVWIRLQRF